MKIGSRQPTKILQVAFPFVLSCALISSAAVAADDTVYPGPENQSAFLKTYTLADTIAPFSIDGSQLSGPGGSSAGSGCAFHDKEFEALVVITPDEKPVLRAAVWQHIKSKLVESAHIVKQRGRPSTGFRLNYTAGKSKGSIVVNPLTILDAAKVAGPGARPDGFGASIRVQIKETWYKTTKKACRKL